MPGLCEDRLADSGLDCVGDHEVHRTFEKALQQKLQVHVGIKRLAVELDDEIKIAAFAALSPDARAEQPETPHPTRVNLITMLFQRLKKLLSPGLQWFKLRDSAMSGQVDPFKVPNYKPREGDDATTDRLSTARRPAALKHY